MILDLMQLESSFINIDINRVPYEHIIRSYVQEGINNQHGFPVFPQAGTGSRIQEQQFSFFVFLLHEKRYPLRTCLTLTGEESGSARSIGCVEVPTELHDHGLLVQNKLSERHK